MKNPTFSAKSTTLDDKYDILVSAFKALKQAGVVKTWTDFATILDVNRSVLSSAKNKDEKYLTDNLIEKVMEYMAEYNNDNKEQKVSVVGSPHTQVVAGNNYGVMNNNEEGKMDTTPQLVTRYAPTIPIKAYRAVNFDVMEYFRTTSEYIHLTPVIAQFPATDCFYFVNSNDMSPNLMTNDLLCLTRLPDDARVTNGDICIINTKYQGILERFVYDEGDHILLKSTQPRWTDMRIPKEEVYSIFRILGGIRTNI